MKRKTTRTEFIDICLNRYLNNDSYHFSDLDLSGENFENASLTGTEFLECDFHDASLRGADIELCAFINCSLRNADLNCSSLKYTKFTDCDLSGTALDPSAEIIPLSQSVLSHYGLELVDDKVIGWRTKYSRHVIGTVYSKNATQPYVAPVFSVSEITSCHPGIYIAGLDYLAKEYKGEALVKCYCMHNELVKAGGKFRCKRLWVVEG